MELLISIVFLPLKHVVMLFMGGVMVALSVEKCNLHRRIALRILMLIGGNPKW